MRNSKRRIKLIIGFRGSLVSRREEVLIKVVSDVERPKYCILRVRLNYLQFLNQKVPKIVLTTQFKRDTKRYHHSAQ